MDERRLTELFQAQGPADDEPPATFSHADVVAASRRQTQRRRRLAAGGVTLGLVVLLGVGIGVARLSGSPAGTDSAAGLAQPAESPRDAAGPEAAAAAPDRAPAPGTGLAECAAPDAELAAAVAQVLPAAPGGAQPVPGRCPAGARGVQLSVTDAGRGDVLRVVLGPQISATELPAGAATRTVRTASGASLTVSALSGVLADRLDAVAQALAARF